MDAVRQGRRERSYPLDMGATEDAEERENCRPHAKRPVLGHSSLP